MENNEEKLGSQEPKKSTKTNSSKKVNTKLIGIIAIAVIIILAVVLMFMTRGAKSTVKDFAKAIEKGDSNKMANLMDMTGMAAYESTKNDLSKFDEVYKNIKEDKEKQKELEEVKETYKNPSNTKNILNVLRLILKS